MNKLPLETVVARLDNFWHMLKSSSIPSHEDLKAAAEYVAKTSGFNSTADMWKALLAPTASN